MRPVYIRFPIVIYRSEESDCGTYTAHCLNLDVLADDDTVEGAVSNLLETIEASLDAADRHKANVFRQAPKEYWDKLAKGTELSPELLERIIFNANRRLGHDGKRRLDVESQCDLRQLQTA